ncbi:MAG: phage tail protein [Tannerella sp.]|jgi:hypothetical protein|nr:phage tail protein [Tannerella sp.]
MDTIQFIKQDSFPLTSDVMEKLQSIAKMSGNLAAILGPPVVNFIVKGCDPDGNGDIQPGVVSINGELMPFAGGTPQTHVEVVETSETMSAFGNSYPGAIITRMAQFSPTGTHPWMDFQKMSDFLLNLRNTVDTIVTVPVGCILPYAGKNAPAKYLFCNGQYVSKSISDLYGVLKAGNPNLPEQGDTFQVPNLRRAFLLGYDPGHIDYMYQGMTGDVPSSTTPAGNTHYFTCDFIIRAQK